MAIRHATDGTIADLTRTDQQPIGYTGYLTDSESGLYYAKARYYDPRIARFTTEDPEEGKATQPPSLHRYLYAYANPTVYVDPTGRISFLTDVRDKLNDTDKILRDWAVQSGDSGGFLGNAGYVGASAFRAVVGLGSLPVRAVNLASDAVASSDVVAAIDPSLAIQGATNVSQTTDPLAYAATHPGETASAIGSSAANTAAALANGDRGAGSDVINLATSILGPGLVAKGTGALNAARTAAEADIFGATRTADAADAAASSSIGAPKPVAIAEAADGGGVVAKPIIADGGPASPVADVGRLAERRAYLDNKFSRTGDLNRDINYRGVVEML
jgi:RHS repeat-associated protein